MRCPRSSHNGNSSSDISVHQPKRAVSFAATMTFRETGKDFF
jgi:hypothetical protein